MIIVSFSYYTQVIVKILAPVKILKVHAVVTFFQLVPVAGYVKRHVPREAFLPENIPFYLKFYPGINDSVSVLPLTLVTGIITRQGDII